MHSLATVLCIVGENFVQIWEFTGQNVLFWRGSIKRADLQTAYRYRIESFRVDFHMIGWSAWVNTRSDHMQVSHSGTSQLNILEILKHFWPASEPCRQATNRNMYFIFLIRAIPPVPYPSCKQEVMSMHNLATVLCKVWWEFRWNLGIYGSKCPILKRVHQTGRSPNGL